MHKIILPILAFLFFLGLPIWLAVSLLPHKSGPEYIPVTFDALQGWHQDDHTKALETFTKSCDPILKGPLERAMPDTEIAGTYSDWNTICYKAQEILQKTEILQKSGRYDTSHARLFFENNFQPISIAYNGNTDGQFTGYYEPMLHGSFTKSERYHVPLYQKPDNLVSINLGNFRDKYKGESLTGIVKNGHMMPFYDRTEIINGALSNKGLELLWVDSAVDAFFLHIQGSGRIQLDDGQIISVGYAGKNGHPYRSIGRILVEANEISLENISLQSIREWLKTNPKRANELLEQNPSFVFFRLLENADGPYGSAGVTLTAERSLAVDRRYIPLHAPLWLDSTRPDEKDRAVHTVPFRHLLIAQDTGGAIKGAIRGDVFWGYGPKSAEIAGRMNNNGKLYMLLPHALATRLTENQARYKIDS